VKNRNKFQIQNWQFLNSKLRGLCFIPTVFNSIPVRQISLFNSFQFHTAYRILAIPPTEKLRAATMNGFASMFLSWKNALNEVRASLANYRGNSSPDLRLWAENEAIELFPTTSIRVDFFLPS
jgi:hypothetical protein